MFKCLWIYKEAFIRRGCSLRRWFPDSAAEFLWNNIQAFFHLTLANPAQPCASKGQSCTSHCQQGPGPECSRAGTARAEGWVWTVKRERKPSVRPGGTSGLGSHRVPQSFIAICGLGIEILPEPLSPLHTGHTPGPPLNNPGNHHQQGFTLMALKNALF